MKIRNTRDLLSTEDFRFVGLIYGLPGTGKTSWLGTCDATQIGIAACETGHGSGALSIADRGVDFCEPENLGDLTKFCKGEIFPDKSIYALDSISAMARGFVKDAALAIPRSKGSSPKRDLGIPEMDDWGSIAEMLRRTMMLLIDRNKDKHIIVTATEKYDRPNENDAPGTESLIGPELAGQMFLGAPAMFDFVFRLRTRPRLRDPKDAKSRYTERYLVTQQESGVIAKSRANNGGVGILDREEIFDITTGQGGFPYILNKLIAGYGGKANAAAV